MAAEGFLRPSAGLRKPGQRNVVVAALDLRSSTRFPDRPNERFARVYAHLDFDVDIDPDWLPDWLSDDVPFSRRIRTNVTLRVFCRGWRDGSGRVDVNISADRYGPSHLIVAMEDPGHSIIRYHWLSKKASTQMKHTLMS